MTFRTPANASELTPEVAVGNVSRAAALACGGHVGSAFAGSVMRGWRALGVIAEGVLEARGDGARPRSRQTHDSRARSRRSRPEFMGKIACGVPVRPCPLNDSHVEHALALSPPGNSGCVLPLRLTGDPKQKKRGRPNRSGRMAQVALGQRFGDRSRCHSPELEPPSGIGTRAERVRVEDPQWRGPAVARGPVMGSQRNQAPGARTSRATHPRPV